MVDQIKHIQMYLLHWYFQQNQRLNIKKHIVHDINRLAKSALKTLKNILYTTLID